MCDMNNMDRVYPRPRITCEGCGVTGSICWGPRKKPHFRHDHNSHGCNYNTSNEYIRKLCRDILCDYLNDSRKIKYKKTCLKCGICDNVTLDAVKYYTEVSYSDRTLDIGGVNHQHELSCCIEIYTKYQEPKFDTMKLSYVALETNDIITNISKIDTKEIILKDCSNYYCSKCKVYDTSHWKEEDYITIAIELGYASRWSYKNECEKILHIVNRCKYQQGLVVWKFTDIEIKDQTRHQLELREVLIYNAKCLRCMISCNVNWFNVYCSKCSKYIKSLNDRHDIIEWIDVSDKLRDEYINKLSWLKDIENITDNKSCIYCKAVDGYTLWLGEYKRICIDCINLKYNNMSC